MHSRIVKHSCALCDVIIIQVRKEVTVQMGRFFGYDSSTRFVNSRLYGRVVKGVGHLGHDEAMEGGGREFDPRPGNWYGFLI